MYGATAIAPPGGGGLPPSVGAVHFWFAPPEQSHSCNRVPFAELLPLASRHRLEAVFTTSFDADTVQLCAPVPLQSQSWINVPFTVPAPAASRHLPNAWIVLPDTFHC